MGIHSLPRRLWVDSLPFCDALRRTSGRKLRRQAGLICRPLPFTEAEKARNRYIYESDITWMRERAYLYGRSWMNNPPKSTQCANNPNRKVPLCCMGPPVSPDVPPFSPQKRDIQGFNIQNCQSAIVGRFFCEALRAADFPDYCCVRLDTSVWNIWGRLGVDCVQLA